MWITWHKINDVQKYTYYPKGATCEYCNTPHSTLAGFARCYRESFTDRVYSVTETLPRLKNQKSFTSNSA